jgi:DNA-binding MarR family transcriptional regulator
MSVGDLARYLMVSRQNLSGVVSRMERDGHLGVRRMAAIAARGCITMTEYGRQVWVEQAQPKIFDYYDKALAGFSINDSAHMLHYLLRMLENMKRLDDKAPTSGRWVNWPNSSAGRPTPPTQRSCADSSCIWWTKAPHRSP